MATGQNSRAVVCVTAYRNYAKAMFSLRSAENFLPGFDLYMVVLDLPEKSPPKEGNIQLMAAETLFEPEDEFYNQAFFCGEQDFSQVVAVKQVQRLLGQYHSVAVIDAGAALCAPILGLWGMLEPDAVLTFEQRPNYGAHPPVWLLQQNIYHNSAGLSFFNDGAKMRRFLGWCLEKFSYIQRMGFSNYNDAARTGATPSLQPSFYASWQVFFPLFGCSHRQLEGPAVVLPHRGEDVEVPALVNFSALKEWEKLPAKQPVLARLTNEYYRALSDLPRPANRYQFNYFNDGTPIFRLLRPYIRFNYRLRFVAGQNPFAHRNLFTDHSVILGEQGGLPLTGVAEAIWLARPDLQQAFPAYRTSQRLPYIGWFLQNGVQEYRLGEAYVGPLREAYGTALEQEEERRRETEKAKRLAGRVARRMMALFGAKNGEAAAQQSLAPYPQGVNLCGFIRGDFGLGEGVRTLADILDASGIPFTIIDMEGEKSFQYNTRRWNHKISNEFIYNTNLMYTNAAGMPELLQDVDAKVLEGRYNIGFWAWELPEFPEQWCGSFALLQEVWTLSQFAADSIATKSPVPVVSIPHSIVVELPEPPLTRKDFALPEAPFLFLMMYDVRSKAARKNPEGAVEAFLKAFEGDERAALLIKLNAPADWDGEDAFLSSLAEYSNIYTLNRTLSRLEVNSLIHCCDAYLSLHRSEGFGLGPAEAMYLGKPAVLTNWSGNTEYMTADNCCPVEYTVIEIEQSHGPYQKGFHWAQPDTSSAAAQMKRLLEDPPWREGIAQKGQQTIQEEFSPAAIGVRVRERLQQVGQLGRETQTAGAQKAAQEENKE